MDINFSSKYSNVVANKDLGNKIYEDLKNILGNSDITLDFKEVDVMTSFCAKQIFGTLYLELGPNSFYNKIKFINASDDLKIIIRESIQNAVEQS